MEVAAHTNDLPENAESNDEKPSSVTVEDVKEDSVVDDEEEDECRVCRGPAEVGNPLFAPCKCSGSIGMTHQDCLMSWLEVTRGDGRCELCKTKFRFDPQYAENAPDKLPAHEVILGLSSRFLAKWLPLAIRVSVAASLWLLAAPLLTSCLYHGWMHRPSSVLTRWKRELMPSDIVSGAIIASIVIISFLSLMSFADFLRVHWQQQQQQVPGRNNGARNQQNNGLDNAAAGEDNNDSESGDDDGGVDEWITAHIVAQRPATLLSAANDANDDDNDQDNGSVDSGRMALERQGASLNELARLREARRQNAARDGTADRGGHHGHFDQELPVSDDEGDDGDGENRPLVDHARDFGDNIMDNEEDLPDLLMPGQGEERRQNNAQGDGFADQMDPGLQDGEADMEINVALDELFGLRGPLSTLIRNLLWLLAFNATYLGIFAFIPNTVGSAVYSGILNNTFSEKIIKSIPYVYSNNTEDLTLLGTIASLNEVSAAKDTTFRLPDLATVTLGYLSIASIVVIIRYCWILSENMRRKLEGINTNTRTERNRAGLAGRLRRDVMAEFEEREVIDAGVASTAIGIALDATVAIVKVGVLLFMKMFLLPLVLGIWLDASTMPLFGHTISNRTQFAGEDLFSFILLHWVAGITFMLLVTVFLLQLREVAHPELLARIIRPQEPQPDLLGNLMNETVATHMKRMILSLGIYAPLLTMHVTLPIKLFVASGLAEGFTFFHLNFWHILMPQLQIPLELIIFHLSMLALLERYKNSIGGLQHALMVFMCGKMGLTEYILPRSISQFEFFGTKEIFEPNNGADGADKKPGQGSWEKVDDFWYELAKKQKDFDSFIQSNVRETTRPERKVVQGLSKENGERVLNTEFDHIRLPSKSGEPEGASQDDERKQFMLPTKIGRYRLKRADSEVSDSPVIEFWREIPGDEIRRPPEGWDDLGAGGAYVQGRWAWGKERKSVIEGTVAQRTPFRRSDKERRPIILMVKVLALFAFSWIAITMTVFGFLSTPLALGRSFYYLFRIPEHYIHDPFAFVIGACLFFPSITLVMRTIKDTDGSLRENFKKWSSRFHVPSSRKFFVFLESYLLWSVVAPLALGVSYEVAIVKGPKWFGRQESLVDMHSALLCWIVGTAVLNTWAFLAFFSVFTKQFWTNVGNGILEPPIDENGMPDVARNNQNVQGAEPPPENNDAGPNDIAHHRQWQGKEGKVAQFFGVWKSVIFSWDWEKVDPNSLLHDFARPLSKQLASALVGSFLVFQFLSNLAPFVFLFDHTGVTMPLLGTIGRGTFQMVLFRTCFFVHVLVQLCSTFHARIESWFHAAHEAARDDRYLIGEILMNYNPDDEQ